MRSWTTGLLAAVVWTVGHAQGDAADGQSAYLKLHPDFLINLKTSGQPRFLLTAVQLKSEASRIEETRPHVPALRHHLLMLFSDQEFSALRSVEGKEQLRLRALEVVNETLTGELGMKAVDDLYFSEFVLE